MEPKFGANFKFTGKILMARKKIGGKKIWRVHKLVLNFWVISKKLAEKYLTDIINFEKKIGGGKIKLIKKIELANRKIALVKNFAHN